MAFWSKEHFGSDRGFAWLRSGASVIAMCAFASAAPAIAQAAPANTPSTNPDKTKADLHATMAEAQPTTPPPADKSISDSTSPKANTGPAIIITGIRQSLANSQQIKRNSDTIVDAITAQDIGNLPDRSVTEALQRVPGVEINRFAGSNDPDHFSVEGSGVTVRGLTFVRSEFNGRDTFSTGVYGQAINFSDVPPELLGTVEVYKNSTADMIEGGLAGTVNLNTRLPFDKEGLLVGFDLEANWGDMRKKWTPTGSLLLSDNWDTGIGRIGFLADLSYSELKSRSDGIQVTNFQTRDGAIVRGAPGQPGAICRNPLPSSDDTMTLPPAGSPCATPETAGADGFADLRPVSYAPLGGQFRTQDFDRKRKGFAAAFQWQSLDRRALLTAQFLRTDSSNQWGEHTFESAPDLSEYNTYPAGCQQNGNGPNGTTRAECRLDASGNFVFGNNGRGQGYNPDPGASFPNYQYDSNGVFENGFITLPGTGWRSASSGSATSLVPTGGMQQSLSRREVNDRNIVQDHGLNFKFNPTPHWAINLDADYTKAQHDTLDVSVFGSTFADEQLDLTGNLPVVTPHKPLTLSATWAAPNPELANATDSEYFHDAIVQFLRAAMEHIEHSKGHEWAFRGDVTYNFLDEVPFLKSLKVGARYADNKQDIRYTTYNWGVLSEVWAGANPISFSQTGPQTSEFFDFNNFFRGQTPGPIGGYYYNGSLISDYNGSSDFFKSINQMWQGVGGQAGWVPLAERAGVVPGTDFLPQEIQSIDQKERDAYAQLNFGNNEPIFGNIRLSGNIGVRFVGTTLDTAGTVAAPTQQALGITQPFSVRCATATPPPNVPPGVLISQPGGICNIGPDAYAALQQFSNGAATPALATNKYNKILPSLNLKFGLTDDLIFRLAGSKVMTRPDIASVRPSFTATYDTNSDVVTFNVGNPMLKPATAWQFDATLEWYFARVGSLTFDAFYKDVKDFFFTSVIQRDFTNNGVTETINVRGPANFPGSGKIKGFELAYQQVFSFLPSPLDGFGVDATYTYIQSKGLPNSFLNNGVPDNISPIGTNFNLPLEQLSKHNINFTLFYEKGPWSLRAAYNWRSKFLLTAADVIFPYDPIFQEAGGQLDASAFYSIRKNIKVGVQAVNLLNQVTKTDQMFTLSGLTGPRSFFMNDRRYSLILRGTIGGSSAVHAPPPVALPPPPPQMQTCPDGSVVAVGGTCPPPPAPPPAPPPPAAPERGG
jgi:TonB-dependent receptor